MHSVIWLVCRHKLCADGAVAPPGDARHSCPAARPAASWHAASGDDGGRPHPRVRWEYSIHCCAGDAMCCVTTAAQVSCGIHEPCEGLSRCCFACPSGCDAPTRCGDSISPVYQLYGAQPTPDVSIHNAKQSCIACIGQAVQTSSLGPSLDVRSSRYRSVGIGFMHRTLFSGSVHPLFLEVQGPPTGTPHFPWSGRCNKYCLYRLQVHIQLIGKLSHLRSNDCL